MPVVIMGNDDGKPIANLNHKENRQRNIPACLCLNRSRPTKPAIAIGREVYEMLILIENYL